MESNLPLPSHPHIRRENVPDLVAPPGYFHLAAVSGAKLIFLAGQVPLNASGELVGEKDALTQATQCAKNLAACLREAGARLEDVVRTTIYVVATEDDALAAVWRHLLESDFSAALQTPATLLGVTRLGYPGQLVEIECTAAVALA
jgi:enamine deaminase RidA (YjgF/YER057c/UK114 family)